MQALARFLVRPSGDTMDTPGDIILGVMFKQQQPNLLRPGRVYEIQEILGTLQIVDRGQSIVGINAKDSLCSVNWSREFSAVAVESGGQFILTTAEAFPTRQEPSND